MTTKDNGGTTPDVGILFTPPVEHIPTQRFSNAANTITWPDLKAEFRKSTNEIEGKEWFELDVTKADTIVIICEGKNVVMDKKDFLQKVGLEW